MIACGEKAFAACFLRTPCQLPSLDPRQAIRRFAVKLFPGCRIDASPSQVARFASKVPNLPDIRLIIVMRRTDQI